MAEPYHRNVEVIGVVRNLQPKTALEFNSPPSLYLCLLQLDEPAPTLLLRGNGNLNAAVTEATNTLQHFGAGVKVLEGYSLEERLARLLWKQRFYGTLLRLIIMLAVILAVFGVYVNTRRVFSLRRQELGIRMAMGATGMEVYKLVLRATFGLVGVGTIIGASLAMTGTRIAQALMPPPFLGHAGHSTEAIRSTRVHKCGSDFSSFRVLGGNWTPPRN